MGLAHMETPKPKAIERLEGDKFPKNEMLLVKKRGGPWVEVPSNRRTHKVGYEEKDLQEITKGDRYSLILD